MCRILRHPVESAPFGHQRLQHHQSQKLQAPPAAASRQPCGWRGTPRPCAALAEPSNFLEVHIRDCITSCTLLFYNAWTEAHRSNFNRFKDWPAEITGLVQCSHPVSNQWTAVGVVVMTKLPHHFKVWHGSWFNSQAGTPCMAFQSMQDLVSMQAKSIEWFGRGVSVLSWSMQY